MTVSLFSYSTDGGRPDLDGVLLALTCRRSRFVCYYLAADDVSEINELFLAREVASWEVGDPPAQISTEKALGVLTELQDEVFPTLSDADLIEYDSQNGTIEYGTPPESAERILSVCQSIEQPR